MMARWLHALQQFHFSIIHRPGNDHGNADRFRTTYSEPHIHLDCLYIDYLEYGMSWKQNSMTLNLSRASRKM